MKNKINSQIPRSLLTIINNIPVINNCQQTLATITPGCAQLAITSHPDLLFNASCTQPGLIIKFYMDLFLALTRFLAGMDFLLKIVRR